MLSICFPFCLFTFLSWSSIGGLGILDGVVGVLFPRRYLCLLLFLFFYDSLTVFFLDWIMPWGYPSCLLI